MKISIVVPCRNENANIEECIRAVFGSKLPENVMLRVFIVDGMSNDGTREKVSELTKEFSSLFLIDNVEKLTPYAFNLGIHAEQSDYVQIIGARHIISENYLSNCLEKLQNDPSVWCVGGKIINEYVNETGRVIASAMSTSLGMGIGNFRTLSKSGYTDTVTSPMYPRWVFEKIGYFDEELIRNQDDDFNYRVTKAGGKIYFDADISLKYYVRGNFKNLWKQFFQYGYWKVYVNQKHKAVTTLRQLVPPIFVAYLFLSLLSWLFGGFVGAVSSLPVLLYLALVSYVSYDITSKDQSLKFGDVFKTFPILHISYGLGYLKGIFDFVLLKKKPSDKQKELSR
jgi:GT2 family glycosyltransferase